MANIAVIGSGIAGLSAAYDLQKQGHTVVVFEAGDMAGGRMADRIEAGVCTHTGASIIYSFNKEMLDLCEDLGMLDDYITFKSRTYNVRNGGKTYPLRLTFDPVFLLTHPAFGLKTKARLPLMLPDMIKAGLTTDPCMMSTAVNYDDGETTTDYLTRVVGEDFLENFVEPYFRAPWHWEPEQISKAYFLSILGHIMGADLGSFRHGIGQLTRTLASRLDVRLNTKVHSASQTEQGIRLVIAASEGEAVLDFHYAVCATEGTKVAGIVKTMTPTEAEFFGHVRYTRGARVYYALNERPPEEYRLWFGRKDPSKVSLFHTIVDDTIVPEGHEQCPYIQLELTPQLSEQVEREGGQDRLDSYVRDELRTLYPGVDDKITGIAQQWWDNMLTEWYPGYTRKVAAFLTHHEVSERKIFYCGDYLSQSHTGGACASGRSVARQLLKQISN